MTSRSRMVYYRVSEKEFEDILSFCQQHAFRSVSDLSREALHRLLYRPSDMDPLKEITQTLQSMREEISAVHSEMERMRAVLSDKDMRIDHLPVRPS